MATAAVPAEVGERECSICNDLFTEPKLLLCGHLLCEKCLQSWAESKKDAQCPLCCRTIVDAQKLGRNTLKEVLKTFPTDFGMKNLVDAERILRKNHVCCVCEDVAAMSICLTCWDMFCPACTRGHQKSSATKHHTVEKLVSVTAETLAANKASVCNNHADRPAEVVCSSHKLAICLLCAGTDHRKCNEIVKVDEKIEKERAQLQGLTAHMSQGESEIDTAMNGLEVKGPTQHRSKEMDDLLKAWQRLNELTKKCSERIDELMLKTHSDYEESVAKERESLQDLKGKLITHKQAATRADYIRDYSELVQMTSTMQKRVNDLNILAVLPSDALKPPKRVVFDEEMASSAEKGLEKLFCSITLCDSFTFSSNHGKDIVLSRNGQVAEKIGPFTGGGFVFSRQRMESNYVYEVQVKDHSGLSSDVMQILPGVVKTPPDSWTHVLPCYAAGWNSATVVVGDNKINDWGKATLSPIGGQLMNLKEGSRVGVSLDNSRNLLIHRDGKCLGVASSAVPQPVYALFKLVWAMQYTMEALPLRHFRK